MHRLSACAALLFAFLSASPSQAQQGPKPAAPAKAAGAKAPAAPAKPGGKPGGAPPNKGAAQGKGGKGTPGKGGNSKKAPRKPGSQPGEPDEGARKVIAGQAGQGHTTRESPELRAMREMDLALFPSASQAPVLPTDPTPLSLGGPRISTSGLPPSLDAQPASNAQPTTDITWIKRLDLPAFPVRWDARVVRYLEFYKNNPRGRSMVQGWWKKSGRYAAMVKRTLRDEQVPEDILWLSLVESGFDPTISSPAGAAGLWQFMPEGGRIYGLTIDRWVDERLDPERATVAAARYLHDLHQRFGSWELAFAAYNMGYGGLLASIRKYNTNDYWELSRLESGMPLETALYVPKIVAMAIVARNKAVFGLEDNELDNAVIYDKVSIGPGTSLRAVAVAAGAPETRLQELNPQLVASRTPPLPPGASVDKSNKSQQWSVRVPQGLASRAASNVDKTSEPDEKHERVIVRWGETLDEIALAHRTTRSSLSQLNGIRSGEAIRPGTVLLLPAPLAKAAAPVDVPRDKPYVSVPAGAFSYPDRQRVFYRVVPGDTLKELAPAFGVTPDDVARWNGLDARASLQEGMSIQLYPTKRPEGAVLLEEKDAHVLVVGSPDFYAHFEALRGRKRIEVIAKEGDTYRAIASKNGLSVAQLERINQKPRSTPLQAGDKVVVYVPAGKAKAPDLTASDDIYPVLTQNAEEEHPPKDPSKERDAKDAKDPPDVPKLDAAPPKLDAAAN
jgi:membrane-bound lytic murein transglycosylase D